MKKKREIVLIILTIIFLTNVVSAVTITIDAKSSFGIGEKISFDYTILSTTSQEIEYLASVNCPNAPLPLLDVKNTSLTANVPFKETYIYMSDLKDDIEPQTCSAIVSISSPDILESKNFLINTNPSFDFSFLTCKDSGCTEQTKVFIKNEDIYLDYSSGISGVLVTGVLTSPDGNTRQLNFPISIKAEQIGTYNLEISASKQGYKTISKDIQFGVIEKQANIVYGFKTPLEKSNITLLVILIISAVVIIASVAYLIYKKRTR